MRPRLPRAVVRRLDRLAWRVHLFHRYAHHPLCDEYAGELVPLGRRARLCRGCALVGLGLVTGVAVGPWVPLPPLGLLAVAAALTALSMAPRAVRPTKWRTRFAPAFALAATVGRGIALHRFEGWMAAGLAVALFSGAVLLYRRRKPDRTPCLTCPERTLETGCRGYRPMVRRERAYQRRAGRIAEQAMNAEARALARLSNEG